MKRVSKLLLLLFGVMLMFTTVLTAQGMAQAATGPVNLVYSHISVSGFCPDTYTLWGYVEVDKMSGTREVSVDYASSYYSNGYQNTPPTLTKTGTVDATYVCSTSSTKEVWRFVLAESIPNTSYPGVVGFTPTFAFSVNYVVNGTTYTDNNSGNKYHISNGIYQKYPYIVLGTANVVFDTKNTSTDSTGTYLNGSLICKNLGSPKTILVTYSLDNGTTYQTTNAEFNQYAPNSGIANESWRYTIKIPTTISEIIVSSISYTVNGVTYVDTNFGNKYIINYPLTYPQI